MYQEMHAILAIGQETPWHPERLQGTNVTVPQTRTGRIGLCANRMGRAVQAELFREVKYGLWQAGLGVADAVGWESIGRFVMSIEEHPDPPDAWSGALYQIATWLERGEVSGQARDDAANYVISYGVAHDEVFRGAVKAACPSYWCVRDEWLEPMIRQAKAMALILDAQKALDVLSRQEDDEEAA
jgi:hypothetical protein